MKITLTYLDVKEAIKNGFVSPLNSKELTPVAALIKSLASYRNAAQVRLAAEQIDQLISESGLVKTFKKTPKTAKKQNYFISYIINELRHCHNLAGATSPMTL